MTEIRNYADNTDQDNLGYYFSTPEDGIDLPVLENYYGPVSESLVIYCMAMDYIEVEGYDNHGAKRRIRLSMDKSKRFINGDVIQFGFPTGQRFCVAMKTDNGGWFYPRTFRERLESITDPEHWAAKLHMFYRV